MAYTWQAEDSIEPISSSTIEAIANIGTYSVATGCTVSYGVGTMICTVASGNVVFSSVLQTVVGNTVTLVADASNPRWTWIAINSSGVAVMVAGTAAASPSVPELGNNVGIALVKVEAAQTSANAIVYKLDKRVLSPASQAVTTTTGDIVYASAAFTPARLGIGSSAQVLTVSGGIPAWASPAADFTTIDKSATETVNNSNTLQSDDELLFIAAANTDYLVELTLLLTTSAAQDMKWAWTLVGMTWDGQWLAGDAVSHLNGVTSGTATNSPTAGANAISQMFQGTFVIHGGSTGGTCNFQWAQITSGVFDTKVLKNSQMRYQSLGAT